MHLCKEATMGKPTLKIIGTDGNVFSILGKAQIAGRAAGWDKEKIDKFTAEAMSGDYDHALQTCMEYFDVS